MKFQTIILSALLACLAGCGGQTPGAGSSSSSSSSSASSSSSSSSTSSSASSSSSSSTSSSSSSSSSSGAAGSLVLAINAGASESATLDGVEYQKDRFANGGTPQTTSDPIDGITQDGLYQSERYGTFSYDVPVTDATYSVVLHFVEMYQENSGSRSFNVAIEGQEVVGALDLFAEVGHDTAYSVTVPNIRVTDQTLSIELESLVDSATISGFAIYSADGGMLVDLPAPQICPASGACRIMPMGDSITDGVGMTGGGAYRIQLFKRAVADNKDITFVGTQQNGPSTVDGRSFPRNHEGTSGISINELAARIPSVLSSDPNIILLMVGTNDVWKEPENARDAQSMANRLGALIDKIVNATPDALLAVALITPRNDYAKSWAQEYVAVIPNVVKQRADMGFNVVVVDQHNTFPANGLATDNLHPNETGYTAMGNTWYEAIAEYLP